MKDTRFPAVDGLRVIAALAVVISQVGLQTHAPFAGVVSRLDVGWAIFCALSGFLLYRPHVLAWFSGTLQFPVGPGKMGDWKRSDFMWFLLSDHIHHRGQFSVYLRMAGGKVPAIYGPSADEPWR